VLAGADDDGVELLVMVEEAAEIGSAPGLGYLAAAASMARSSTSHKATMFSELTPARLACPRPPTPMRAMLSRLAAFCPRTKAGATIAAAPAATN
jgi:hypothetical protein